MNVDARCLPSQTTTWLTPRWILDALGEFDLDPCCPPEMPWRTAERMIHQPEDGLSLDWDLPEFRPCGRVWLNPPYGRGIDAWMEKLTKHAFGVALVFARTETRWFQSWVLDSADAILVLDKRVRFCLPDGTQGGTPPVGSVLAFYNLGHDLDVNYAIGVQSALGGRWVYS